jgi:hypothetical protein
MALDKSLQKLAEQSHTRPLRALVPAQFLLKIKINEHKFLVQLRK